MKNKRMRSVLKGFQQAGNAQKGASKLIVYADIDRDRRVDIS